MQNHLRCSPLAGKRTNLQRRYFVVPRHLRFRIRFLNFVQDACEVLRGLHLLLGDIALFAVVIYGLFHALRLLIDH